MKGTIRATVKVAGIQRERRFVPGTPARVIKAWKIHERAKILKRYPVRSQPRASGSTLAADAARYLLLVKHLSDWVTRRSELQAWLKADLGTSYRHLITREMLMAIRGQWVEASVKPKTINNRVTALRNLYHVLDGDDAPTPCDGLKPLQAQKVPPQIVTPDVINVVIANLKRPEDQARLMVLASTGKRPCEVMRAKPGDVDLRRRVWLARDAKGGFSPGAYLNDEMVLAWEAFIQANAWGEYNTTHFQRRLIRAGWPEHVRPYNLRHATWIEASERGADLADVQAGAGHKLIATTRRHYVPVLSSRMQKMSESLEGRFGWSDTAGTPSKTGTK
jgi:integrase